MPSTNNAAATYVNLEPLAETAHGRLYRAERSADGAPVVLKQRAAGDVPFQRQSLRREFEALQRVASPLVVKGWEVCDIDGKPTLVCEYVAGADLGRAKMPLALGELLHVAQEAARGLSLLHERGVVHNDIKPSNLIYDRVRRALTIVDFDVASVEQTGASELTGAEGSLPYLPPERTGRMNRLPDYRADFYSLGVTLFELASGKLPFEANDALGWAHAHLSKAPPLLSEVNPAVPMPVVDLIAKLLAKNPDQRYQSAFGLLADLTHCAKAWTETQSIPPFTLGASDISQTFKVSRELVGRSEELAACLRALPTATDRAPRVLMLSGAAGIGKTSLVRDFLRSADQAGATTLYAAFEQHNQGRPYSALVSALEELVSRVLAQSEAHLDEVRQRLHDALGVNTAVIAEFVPRLVRVLGACPASPVVSPTEAKHRLQGVVRVFLRAFVEPGRPLVLALDDCQWLDASTAEMLKELVASGEVPHLLVVLSYRDELDAFHPLIELAVALRGEGPASLRAPVGASLRSPAPTSIGTQPSLARSLHLGPLPADAVKQLLVASFRATVEETDDLAHVLHEKTDGNPYFINELLETLSAERVLSLDGNVGKWRWDMNRARAQQVSANVADLVSQRLERLGPAVRSALGAAACLGLQFSLAEVARVSGLSHEAAGAALWQAASERLVTTGDASDDGEVWFAFPHTRVLEAANASLDSDTKAQLHRRIGAELVRRWKEAPTAVQLFDVLHHVNLAEPLITDAEELTQLIHLNLEGTARARRTAAFDVARAYADVAVHVAGRCSVPRELAFEVRFRQAEAAYLTGAFELADAFCEGCFDFADTPLLRGQVHALKARVADHRAHLLDAIAEIRSGLRALGVSLPETHAEIDRAIGPGLGKMMEHLSRMQVEDLVDLPTAKSPETALVLELLMQVVPPSIQTYPPLFIVAELMMFDLEMEHGVTAVSCKNFVDCGILQASILGNHDTAYRLGQVAFKLLERFKPTPLEAAVNFVFAGFVSHWKAHFREAEAAYETVKRVGVELGDLQHVAYAYAHHTQRSLYVGRPLDACARELDEAVSFLTRGHHSGPVIGTTVAARAIARLRAAEGDEAAIAEGDAAATEQVLASKNAQWGYSYGQGQTAVSFFLRDYPAARHWQDFTKPFALAAASLFSVPDYHLFDALIELWSLREDASRHDNVLALVDGALATLAVWAKAAPENFGHKYELLAAERARAAGEALHVVLDGYQRAVDAAGHDFPHFRALTHELEAESWLDRGDGRRAKPALEEAHRLYGVWGASAKVRQLERRHPWLKAATARDEAMLRSGTMTATTTSNDLDAGSILKATQAISKEVETHKLFAALMSTLIESAGAERGCLVLESDVDHRHYVEARADVDADHDLGQPVALDQADAVSASVVRYVLRTREAVALDDAATGGPFQNDPYIQDHRVRSLLCVPIERQGQVLGVLYLENNQTTHAFTRQRVGILQVVASQAAISIYNAQLYSSLERRVKERTAELAQKNRQIATMLDNMDQGVFTIDGDLVIQPGYSRYLERVFGTTDIVGKRCMQLLFQGAAVRPDVLQAADGALQFSFGVDSWLAAANAPHLIREFQRVGPSGERQYLEVDWNFICDEGDVVEKILVVVRDVTLVRQLQKAAAERGREADIVTQLIDTGVESFTEFANVARDFLAQNESAVRGNEAPSPDVLARSFRNLHTLKGNARLLGYSHLVDAIHDAEERYDVLRRDPDAAVEPEVLLGGLEHVRQAVEHYENVCHGKLSKVGHSHDRRLDDVVRDIGRIVHEAQGAADTNALADVARVLRRLEGTSLTELVLETSRIVPSLAQELGKATPVVACTGAALVLTKDWANTVRDILVQCFRNALFHGLEAETVRVAQGRPGAGKITLDAQLTADGFEMRIGDDGRGLALAALRERAKRDDLGDERLAEIIFESGVSTAREVGLIAGRGVGLDIVRALLRNGGGDVNVHFTAPERDGFRPFELVLRLPNVAVVDAMPPVERDYRSVAAE